MKELHAQLNDLLSAAEKIVNIEIDKDDLKRLKIAEYSLCFAKKVGEDFNVVWKSSMDYLVDNRFSWTPQYQLFGTNTFKDSVTVKATTNIERCGLHQTCTLDEYGVLSGAVDGSGPETALQLVNNYAPIRVGVNQMVVGIDGKQASLPIYVSKNQIMTGDTNLTPVEIVQVWFEQNVKTSTMFSTSRSNAIELDLTDTNLKSILYSQGKWAITG